MPEGDTIAWHASRMGPALQGHAVDSLRVHQRFSHDRWPERLVGQTVERIQTRGKHLLIHFDGGLLLHSHLGMVGSWGVYRPRRRWGRSPRRAWLIIRVGDTDVVEFDGSTLELMSEGRARIDQRNLAGIGNMWKAEACWEAELDPWRETADVSDEAAIRAVELVRPRMQLSAREGPRAIERFVYKTGGRPCLRCGARISVRSQGDENRLTYWCSGCQR